MVILVVAKYYHNQYNNIHNTPMGIMDSCQPLDRNVRWFKAPWPLDQERVASRSDKSQRLVYERTRPLGRVYPSLGTSPSAITTAGQG